MKFLVQVTCTSEAAERRQQVFEMKRENLRLTNRLTKFDPCGSSPSVPVKRSRIYPNWKLLINKSLRATCQCLS